MGLSLNNPLEDDSISVSQMKIGDIGYITNWIAPTYIGFLVMRTYDGLICLENPRNSWDSIEKQSIHNKVKLIPKGTKLEFTVN